MSGKKGLIAAALALVAVLAVGGMAYGVLGQNAANPATTLQSSTADGSSSGATDGTQGDVAGNTTPSNGETAGGTTAQEDDASGDADSTDTEAVALPSFVVQDRQGNSVASASLQGKPSIVCFWATWCPPCNEEAPHIQTLYDAYGDQVNFMMVDVTDGDRDTPEVVEEWIADGGYTYPIYLDTTLEAANSCQVYYLPTTFALDTQGNIVAAFSGALDEESGTSLIEQLLAT